MGLSRDPAKAQAWQDRSRAKAMAKPRKVPTDRRRQGQALKPRSAKRERDMVTRRELVRDLLRRYPRCQARWVCQGARSVDCHERLKRSRGGSIVDLEQSHAIAICRACHERTESHVAEATARRLLIPSWHVCPEIGPC